MKELLMRFSVVVSLAVVAVLAFAPSAMAASPRVEQLRDRVEAKQERIAGLRVEKTELRADVDELRARWQAAAEFAFVTGIGLINLRDESLDPAGFVERVQVALDRYHDQVR
jgi:septal ring factor EnvC (AmiA/AmiB activator)